MSAEDQTAARSPWLTVWFSPRLTIERLVATRPTYFVGVLLVLSPAAALYNEMARTGIAGALADWRFALVLALASVALGTISYYVGAWIINALGRLLGGRGSLIQTRAAAAWSAPPIILCSVIILLLGTLVNNKAVAIASDLLIGIFSLWSIVIFLRMLGRVQDFGFWRALFAVLLNLVLAAFIAIFVRSFFYQPFNIPSRSMMPTLLVGDYIFVSKFAYGYGRYSLPFSLLPISGRILPSQPERGDVVVFRVRKQNADFVKRVIGLPGDRVQMKQGLLYLNDTPVERERVAENGSDNDDACGLAAPATIKRWRETLPNGVSYETIDCFEGGRLDNTNVSTVPPGQFFVLGDNRDNSTDSRIFGSVRFEDMIGHVRVIYYSRESGESGVTPHARTERIGMVVR